MKENIPKVWERNLKILLGSGYFILFKVRKKIIWTIWAKGTTVEDKRYLGSHTFMNNIVDSIQSIQCS
jgi:hypothetical protein